MLAIQETMATSVDKVLGVFNNHEAQACFPDDLCTPGPLSLNTATPLGLHRPLEKSLKDKILQSEYIDFCLLLPNVMYRSQTLLCTYAVRTCPWAPRFPANSG